ncbi:MAG: hypothetical protein GY777_23065 [Candidatus Brocadiaceae bacterium]|nr:hypothetical protein [Candidatus Brocadiaceae bacterium]
MNGDENAEEVFETLKKCDVQCVWVGMKVVILGKKKGNAWWMEEVKEAVSEKREAYKRTLQ